MRFLKALWLTFFFFFSLLFFVQNKEVLGQQLTLVFDTYYFNYTWTNTAVPFYFVVLTGFLAGVIATIGYFFMDTIRARSELGRCRKIIRKQDKEIKTLRAIPLQSSTTLLESGDKASADSTAVVNKNAA